MNAHSRPAEVGEWPDVSVIMTVLNEAAHLRAAVDHVRGQDYPGEIEVVIALGPSTDGTDTIAADLTAVDPRVRTVPNPTGRTPNGLNAALRASKHDIVARVDGHALLPPDYLSIAVQTLLETGADNVGGIMWAEGETAFERAVARAMTSPFGVGSARFHTGGAAGRADTVYLGVFRKSALDRVGGYDEAFLRAQDWEMNYRIRKTGGQVWFQPRIRVSYRPRGSVRALAKQYYHYGRWRRVVMRQHPGTANLRYLAPPMTVVGAAAGLVAGLAGGLAGSTWLTAGLIVPGAYAAAIIGGALATARGLPPQSRLWLPFVYGTMHGAWGVGFLASPRSLGRGAKSAQR